MKKITLIISVLFFSFTLRAQHPLTPVLKSYFRTHPFEIRFSSFITSLQSDPWFKMETFDKRTDTSFFYISGTYLNFNPFGFKAKEVRFTIAEDQYSHTDSLKTLDTIMNIQIMGITDAGSSNLEVVKKEYSKFQKKFSSLFWKNNYSKNEKNNELIWEITNYFLYPYSISPVTVAWGNVTDSGEYIFIITLRCKIEGNLALFVLPPEGM